MSAVVSQTLSLPVVLGGEPTRPFAAPEWPVFGRRESELLRQALESGRWAYEGPFETAFERRFADVQTARYGLCVANGTVALQLALEALDVGAGDEVIVPGLTFQATAAAALEVNAAPVLVDVEPATYCLDPALIEAAITPRTKAIIAVHLYNSVADLDRILDLARRHGLRVIEDCAHGHGSQWNGRGLGSLGDLGTFSFQSSKTLTAGEGGFVSTNDPTLRDRLASLRNCGRRPPGADPADWRLLQGGNHRLTEWQAAVLTAQLERFDEQMARREANAALLDAALAEIPGIKPMVRYPQVNRRNLYAYVFRYDPAAFDGLSGQAFRLALSRELGIKVRQPYAPLHRSALYQPLTKRRHRLGPAYETVIEPTRFALPVAERAYATEAMVIAHQVLLADPVELSLVPDAVRRLQRHAPRLVAWERAAPPELAHLQPGE
jgi:L-glutamine:2-deoxy-scyllo-inosose/3-amino-2,3-dideoxy-scyllo-inosose aminotransferase